MESECAKFSQEEIQSLLHEVDRALKETFAVSGDAPGEFGSTRAVKASLLRDLNAIERCYYLATIQAAVVSNETLRRSISISRAAKTLLELTASENRGSVDTIDQIFEAAGLWELAPHAFSPLPLRERAATALQTIEELQRSFRSLAKSLEVARAELPPCRTQLKLARHELYQNLASCYELHWSRPAGISNPHRKKGATEPEGPFVTFLVFAVGRITGDATPAGVVSAWKRARKFDFNAVDQQARAAWFRKTEKNLRGPCAGL